jgi:hypothetical protein
MDRLPSTGSKQLITSRLSRVRAGQPKESAVDLRKAVELWAKTANPNAEDRFEKARAVALLAGLGAEANSGVSADKAKTFADQAVAALADAIKAVWSEIKQLKAPTSMRSGIERISGNWLQTWRKRR